MCVMERRQLTLEFNLDAVLIIFYFNDTATPEIYPLSLHAALPIWRRPDRSGLMAVGRGDRRQPAPRDLSRQAQPIEPEGVVVAEPRRQHVRFPGSRGHLVTVELLQHRRESFRSLGARLGRGALPAQQEPHEIRRGDRLDFLAQPVERVPMDPGEQAALAPLELGAPRREPAAQREPLALGALAHRSEEHTSEL